MLSRYDRINYIGKYMFFFTLSTITILWCMRLLRSELFTLTCLLFIVAHRIILLYPRARVNVHRHAMNDELLQHLINVKDRRTYNVVVIGTTSCMRNSRRE